jgi:DNA-binding SARP family transcriptional activator
MFNDSMGTFGDALVIHTRLTPPRVPRRWLRRARLDQHLAEAADHALTVVHASAGYGKSSLLASFATHGGWPMIWYSVDEDTANPHVFLLHLVHACHHVAPDVGHRTLALVQGGEHGAHVWRDALDAFLNDLLRALDDDTLLVLDDYHVIDNVPPLRTLVERLITHRPPQLHVVLGTRHWPTLGCMPLLQARGEVLAVTEHDLAFTPAEVATLFAEAYNETLSHEEAAAVVEHTGGWAIALQLLAQGTIARMKHPEGTQGGRRKDYLGSPASSFILHPSSFNHDVLFAYLAHDVLERQPHDVQHFLLRSSVLQELDPPACNYLLGSTAAEAQLSALERQGVFVQQIGHGRYRYHPLFHAFLQQHAQAGSEDWAAFNRSAAAYYRAQGAGEAVLHHLLAIGDMAGAAEELERWAQLWIDAGRYVTLLHWLDHLPPDVLAAYPSLLLAQGDAARLLDRFDTALAAYHHAERIYAERADTMGQAQALRAQALVYLDTVQPALADDLLKRAYRLLPCHLHAERADMLRFLAENRLNEGRASQAARLLRLADRLAPSVNEHDHMIEPRMLLRQGRLGEAHALLEQGERNHRAATAQHRPAHRDVTLLLALVCAFEGDSEGALRYAQHGWEATRQAASLLGEAIAHIRLGHALQLGKEPDPLAAHQHYLASIALADTFGGERTKAEAYLGLALLHGFGGDWTAAHAAAQEGLALAEGSGDRWSVALLWTALGALGVVHHVPDAAGWLHQALHQFECSKDTYGQAVAHLWLAVLYGRNEQHDRATTHTHRTLALAQEHGYHGLLTRPTLFGPRDRMLLVPLLLAGCADGRWREHAQTWLAQGFPAIAVDEANEAYYPGATLRIHLFGLLRVWRGTDEVGAREWTRRKAPHLLALLVANRHRWLLRDQICEWLWPDLQLGDAAQQFKVTLNALNAVLEPGRSPRSQPFYIRRQGQAYRFAPPDGVWLDVDEFEARVAAAQRHIATQTDADLRTAQGVLTIAIGLYGGEYLSDYVYEEWTRNERERLAVRYLEAATMLAELFLCQHQLPEAIQLGEMIVSRDPCWENAYRLLMRAYAASGNRRQALLAYERCVRNLRTQLDIAPLPQTQEVYEALKR